MKTNQTARLQIITAMVIFGTIGIFVRHIALPSSVIALVRGGVGALFLLAVTLLRGAKLDWQSIRRNLPALCCSGTFLGFNWILLFEAYRYTTVSTATLCYYMAPIMVILVSPILLREKLTGKKLACVLAALAGMVGVSGVVQSGIPAAGEMRGILLGLAAASLYAAIVLLNKFLRELPAFDRTIMQLGISALVMGVYCFLTVRADSLVITPRSAVLLLVVGVLHTGVTYYLYFGSMAKLPGQTVAIISYVDPVVAVLASVILLREPMVVSEVLGALLVLGAALVSELELPGKKGASV